MSDTEGDTEGDRDCGELLRQSLAEFRDGSSPLRNLVDDVESICRSLSDPVWRDRLRTHWWTLEQVYAADVLQQGHETLTADAARSVENAVGELEAAAAELETEAGTANGAGTASADA